MKRLRSRWRDASDLARAATLLVAVVLFYVVMAFASPTVQVALVLAICVGFWLGYFFLWKD